MISIRTSVFETNSSSSHSITISPSSYLDDTINPAIMDGTKKIVLSGGEFGWEVNEYNDALTKANYCAVDAKNDPHKLRMLIKVIKHHCKVRKVTIELDPHSYIDHQSNETSFDAFKDEDTLKRFIFNTDSVLYTDNDNHD